jgi:hypothetical protein
MIPVSNFAVRSARRQHPVLLHEPHEEPSHLLPALQKLLNKRLGSAKRTKSTTQENCCHLG